MLSVNCALEDVERTAVVGISIGTTFGCSYRCISVATAVADMNVCYSVRGVTELTLIRGVPPSLLR
jgi:hypothetical protein